MAKTILSWILVGALSYLWWWIGYEWSYLNSEGADWTDVYLLFTLISLVVLRNGKAGGGSGMFDRLIGTVTGFIPQLPWLVVVVLTGVTIWSLHLAPGFMLDNYLQGAVMAITAGLTTALWHGAIDNASG